MSGPFAPRETVEQVEEGHVLAPKFDANGLIPVVTTDFTSGELLMHGYMNEEALKLTIKTGEAHYYSRSREAIWHKAQPAVWCRKSQKCVSMTIRIAFGCALMSVAMAPAAMSAIAHAFIVHCRPATCRTCR